MKPTEQGNEPTETRQNETPEIPQKELYGLIVKCLDALSSEGGGIPPDIRDEMEELGLFRDRDFVAELASADSQIIKFVPMDLRSEAVENQQLDIAKEIEKRRKELSKLLK